MNDRDFRLIGYMLLTVFIGVVTAIVFSILKLVAVLTWSWVWILCPLWATPIICLIIFLLFCIHYRRCNK